MDSRKPLTAGEIEDARGKLSKIPQGTWKSFPKEKYNEWHLSAPNVQPARTHENCANYEDDAQLCKANHYMDGVVPAKCDKWQPAPAPSGWGIDTSAGREILVYDGCSVIEAEQARQVLAAMTETAPLPGEVTANVRAAVNALRNGLYPRKCTIRGLLSAVSDLTRRLAEAEVELAEVRSRNSILAVQRADAVHLAKANPTQAYQRIQRFKERAEAAEARVMAWARGRCECCGTDQGAEICFKCRHGYDLGEYPQAAQYADNWTPPQAWEVGE